MVRARCAIRAATLMIRVRIVAGSGCCVRAGGEVPGGAGEVMGDRGAGQPGVVRVEPARRQVRQGPGDQVGVDLLEDGDVVGGGVRSGPAFAEQPGQGFAGVVQEAETAGGRAEARRRQSV